MGHKVNLMLFEELCSKGPGSVSYYLIHVATVGQGVISFILCHHCVAFKLVGELITADSHNQVCVGEHILGLHQSSCMARMEKIKDAICVDSHRAISWCSSPCLSNGQLFMQDV